ncbi:efflux transporter, RND family, MFP subunit, partial [Vibrio parahaemolyticus V-223/04]
TCCSLRWHHFLSSCRKS